VQRLCYNSIGIDSLSDLRSQISLSNNNELKYVKQVTLCMVIDVYNKLFVKAELIV
jgi:hypothetical protein